MGYSKRPKKTKLPPFVPLLWDILNHKAYKELPHSAAKALPYFLGKVQVHYREPARYTITFDFSYREASKLGFARGTHHRTICALTRVGFIDPVMRGGLRSMCYSSSQFKLSTRWTKFGEKDFVQARWEGFEPEVKLDPIRKMEHNRSKSGTQSPESSRPEG